MALWLLGCQSPTDTLRITDLPSEGWRRTDYKYLRFQTDENVAQNYALSIILRTDKRCEQVSIPLQLDFISPDSHRFIDTVSINLHSPHADQREGERIGNYYDISQRIYERLRFNRKGIYTVRLKQLATGVPIEHLTAIGIKLEKHNE